MSTDYIIRSQEAAPRSVLGQMLTVKQAAAYLGISPAALYQRLASGTAPKHYKPRQPGAVQGGRRAGMEGGPDMSRCPTP